MAKLLQRIHNRKGFTLVEVIVVLVILAILAALLVPKLTGWIDQAKEKSVAGEAHLVLSAAQAVASEEYAQGSSKSKLASTDYDDYLSGDVTGTLPEVTIDKGKVTGFTYTGKNGKSVTYSIDSTTNEGVFK